MAHTKAEKDFLKTARDRWKLANDADTEQAQRERDDIAFEAGDQWPADIRAARQGQQPTGGLPAVPARPTLTINKVKEPVRQVLNQERASDLGIELVPADDFGDLGITPDDTEITLREGLVRRIQRDSVAADARTWAFKRAVIAGRGYYMVMTRFLPGASWDQEVYIHRIYNQAGVLLDPTHEQPDGSDSDWGFVGTWMPWDRYTGEHPNAVDGKANPHANYTDTEFMGAAEEYPDWYRAGDSGQERAVRVVDYYYTERTARTLVMLEDGTPAWEDEIPDDAPVRTKRTVIQKQIKFCKIGGGDQILEETDWVGTLMPIIKVLGDEVLPYDGKRRSEGMVRPARDAQLGENALISKFVEKAGLAAIPRDRIDPNAISGYEAWWQAANTRTLPYLPYRTRDDEGREFRQPIPANPDADILPLANGIAMFDQFIKSTTAVPDSTLGNVDPSLKSGRAIREVVANAAQSTSNFLDNLARSVRYEGEVINDLLYPIYGQRPGRLVRVLTGEGDGQMMRIGEAEQAPEMQQQAAQQAKAAKVGKLTKDAHFNVIVKITKSSENRREQFTRMFSELLAADPMQMAVGGDLFYRNMDIPEAKQLAERQRLMLAPPIQQMLASQAEGQEAIPPAAQQQISELTERLQQAEGAMQELAGKAEGKVLDAETKLKIAELESQRDVALKQAQIESDYRKEIARIDADLELARMDNATKLRVAEIAAETKGLVSAQAMEHEAMALAHEQEHESTQAAEQREHEARVTEQGQRHASEEAERARQAEAMNQEGDAG